MTAGRLRSLDDIAFCDDLHQMQMILIDCEEVFDQGDADLDQHFQRLRKFSTMFARSREGSRRLS